MLILSSNPVILLMVRSTVNSNAEGTFKALEEIHTHHADQYVSRVFWS